MEPNPRTLYIWNKPMNVAMKVLPCILTLLLILSGCGLFGTEGDEFNARISEDGVDGVRFGDTKAEAVRILGPPDYVGIADGEGRAWYAIDYRSGPHNGLSIYFTETIGEPDSLAPADFFDIRAPFPGKTLQDIGIGSTREQVQLAYGQPHDSIVVNAAEKVLFFCMGKRNLQVATEADTVSVLFLGFYEPFPAGQGGRDCSR